MDIKPIRTERDNEAVLARINELWCAKPGTPEGDEFEILVTLVEAFEEVHYPMPDPIEAIKFCMEQAGLKQEDLIDIIGPRGRVSEIMNRKRDLTLPMIRRLNKELGIPLESLIGEAA